MEDIKSLKLVEFIKINGGVVRAKERVVAELSLNISINDKFFAKTMITPIMKKEFIIGYLFGQRVIDNADEVKSIVISNGSANVIINKIKKERTESLEITSDFRVTKDDIFRAVSAILKSRIYAETEAIHSAGLFGKSAETICIVEDFGRHNALDKVIGYALINKIDLRNTFATSTGRMASDMVTKICRAGIPIVATKTAVTSMGLEIGEKYGLTIVGFVREAGTKLIKDTGVQTVTERLMKIYTHPQRIIL